MDCEVSGEKTGQVISVPFRFVLHWLVFGRFGISLKVQEPLKHLTCMGCGLIWLKWLGAKAWVAQALLV